jgi:hypothetical protein
MRVGKREFAGEISQLDLMPRSNENMSCMRVDESWLDVTKGSKNSSQLSLKLGSTKFPIRQLRLSLLFPLECFSDRQLLQALLEISSKLTRTDESWRSDASLLGLCKKWSVHLHVCIVFSPNQPIAVLLSRDITCTMVKWKHSYWLLWRKYNTHVTMNRPFLA